MDIHDFFLSCRRGDLARAQYLVEAREVDVNIRDRWDSTPLYYACLCGHDDVVRFLLERGAKCEMNTFDGERCIYGALSNEIRKLLKEFKAVQSMQRDPYCDFLTNLYERGHHSDITFIVHGQSFYAHRCILSARSEYFAELIETRWKDKREVTLSHKLLTPIAFRAILQYLYTARLECPYQFIEDVIRLANYCQLKKLETELMAQVKAVIDFESEKPGVNITVLSLEPKFNDETLNKDLGKLALNSLLNGFSMLTEGIDFPDLLEKIDNYSDIIFEVEGYHFQCHKAFFVLRSDYFKALCQDHFGETDIDASTSLPLISIHDVPATSFFQIVAYVYQDTCDLNSENIFDILHASEMYLLPGLKRRCSNALAEFIDVSNVVQMLRTSRLFSLAKLEDQCAEFIAANLYMVLDDPTFADYVNENAQEVKDREETDSIGIIDDIRYHIANFVQSMSDTDEANDKLTAIDEFLIEQGLDA